jgi:Bromodomain
LLSSLLKHKDAKLFLRPVNPDLDGAPDYFDYVKNPMDLGTIHDKLANHQYPTPRDLLADLTLMFDNCYTYNHDPANVVHLMGRSLQAHLSKQWAELHLDWYQPSQANTEPI